MLFARQDGRVALPPGDFYKWTGYYVVPNGLGYRQLDAARQLDLVWEGNITQDLKEKLATLKELSQRSSKGGPNRGPASASGDDPGDAAAGPDASTPDRDDIITVYYGDGTELDAGTVGEPGEPRIGRNREIIGIAIGHGRR
jgi:hypothetical protein